MSKQWIWTLVAVFGLGALLFAYYPQLGSAQVPGAAAMTGPRYTVVETQGTSLLVVDNATNTLYYYTAEPDKEVGAELKLRGTVDLNAVGKPTLQPRKAG